MLDIVNTCNTNAVHFGDLTNIRVTQSQLEALKAQKLLAEEERGSAQDAASRRVRSRCRILSSITSSIASHRNFWHHLAAMSIQIYCPRSGFFGTALAAVYTHAFWWVMQADAMLNGSTGDDAQGRA
jgi:hypothetical protein